MKLLPNLLRQVGAYCIKHFKKYPIYLEQHYGTAIQPVPYNEVLHEKGTYYYRDCKPSGMLCSRTSWNAPRNDIRPIAEVRVLCQDFLLSA